MSDKCPFCKAVSRYERNCNYTCGTFWQECSSVWIRKPECYNRQISQLQAENETLKALRDELFERNAQLQARIAELEGPGMVTVKKADLEKAIDFMENTAGTYWIEIANRLKSALES